MNTARYDTDLHAAGRNRFPLGMAGIEMKFACYILALLCFLIALIAGLVAFDGGPQYLLAMAALMFCTAVFLQVSKSPSK